MENQEENVLSDQKSENVKSTKKRKKFWDKSLFTIIDSFGRLNLFALAIPQFLELFFINSLGVISTVIINHISAQSAVGVDGAAKVINIVINLSGFINTGSAIMLSIYMGRNNSDAVKKICFMNFIVTTIINLSLSTVLFIFARPILALTRLSGESLTNAVIYTRIRAPFLFISSLSACVTTTLRCYGNAKPTFVVGIVANIVSVTCSIIAISKISPIPSKITGVSIASVLGTVTSGGVALIYWLHCKKPITKQFDGKLLKQLVKIGFPGGMSSISYSLSQLITTVFIHTLPGMHQYAKIYVSSLVFVVYQLGYSIGSANSIMVGRRCGAGELDKADRMHKQNIFICIGANILLMSLFITCYRFVFKIFTSDPKTLDLIFKILLIDMFVEIGRALNHMGEFALNGVGDVYATTIISMSSCWLISVAGAYLFGIVFNMGLIGIWLAFMLDELTRGTLYLIRWLSGKWKRKFIENKI